MRFRRSGGGGILRDRLTWNPLLGTSGEKPSRWRLQRKAFDGCVAELLPVVRRRDLVRPERFELPAYCSGGNRSIQLSYGRTDSGVPIPARLGTAVGVPASSVDYKSRLTPYAWDGLLVADHRKTFRVRSGDQHAIEGVLVCDPIKGRLGCRVPPRRPAIRNLRFPCADESLRPVFPPPAIFPDELWWQSPKPMQRSRSACFLYRP